MRPLPHLSIFFFLLCLVLFTVAASAFPAGSRAVVHDVLRRQEEELSQPITVQTSHTSNTSMGPVIEECMIQMTPITLDNGESAVEMVKNCTLSLETPVIPQPLPADPDGTGSSSASSTSTTLDLNPSSSSFVSTIPAPSSSSTTPSSSSTTPSSSSTTPTSSDTSTSLATDSPVAATPTPQDTAPAAPTSADPPVNVGQQNPVSTSSDPSASATAAGALGSSGPDAAIPGKKLSVLPIGLGVFAGISIIALVIVGLVTYERTKYRKLFRKRKRAEALDFGTRW